MKPFAVLALAVVAISWAAILIRLSSAPPLAIAFWRLAISSACLLPLAMSRSQRSWLRGGRVRASTLGAGALLGLHFAAWITSLQLTSVASSVVLVTTAPVFAAFLSARVLGEKPGGRAWLGIALSLAGAALIAWGDSRRAGPSIPVGGTGFGVALAGDLLALAGAIFAAAYLTVGRSVRSRAPLIGYLTVVYATGAGLVGCWAWLRGDRLGGYSAREYLLFAAIALGPNLIGHSLLNWGVRRLRTYVVNVAVLGEPVLASIYAAFVLHEVPGPFWAAGAALIVSGVLMIVLAERSRAAAESLLAEAAPG